MINLEDIRDEYRQGPRAIDVFKALRILQASDVEWALGIIQEAMKADERLGK